MAHPRSDSHVRDARRTSKGEGRAATFDVLFGNTDSRMRSDRSHDRGGGRQWGQVAECTCDGREVHLAIPVCGQFGECCIAQTPSVGRCGSAPRRSQLGAAAHHRRYLAGCYLLTHHAGDLPGKPTCFRCQGCLFLRGQGRQVGLGDLCAKVGLRQPQFACGAQGLAVCHANASLAFAAKLECLPQVE